MTVIEEIDSFVKKFLSLSSKGIQAKLFLETEAGKASINLCANLGQVSSLPEHIHDVGRRVGALVSDEQKDGLRKLRKMK